jgi:hypothetical protein
MRNTWLEILDRVLDPIRPELPRCSIVRERHLAARRQLADERARAIAECEQRINDARTEVFATNDGVVGALMTDLEREWRRLSRPDPDAGLMDLWARIAPPAWIDHKRWRDSAPESRVDAATALAADPESVIAAESAIASLRVALAPFGTVLGARIRWRFFEEDREVVTALLSEPLRAATEACPSRHRTVVLERARRIERVVHDAAIARLPTRPRLARDIAHAALVDFVWSAGPPRDRQSPTEPLRALWQTGYGLATADASAITIEMPLLAIH